MVYKPTEQAVFKYFVGENRGKDCADFIPRYREPGVGEMLNHGGCNRFSDCRGWEKSNYLVRYDNRYDNNSGIREFVSMEDDLGGYTPTYINDCFGCIFKGNSDGEETIEEVTEEIKKEEIEKEEEISTPQGIFPFMGNVPPKVEESQFLKKLFDDVLE